MASKPIVPRKFTSGIVPPPEDLGLAQNDAIADWYLNNILSVHGDIEVGDDEIDFSTFAAAVGRINTKLQTTVGALADATILASKSGMIEKGLNSTDAANYKAHINRMNLNIAEMRKELRALQGKQLSLGWGLAKIPL